MISKLSLQQALAGLQRTQPASSKGARTATQPRRTEGSASSEDERARAAAFEQQVRHGVSGINPDDPRRRQRALRVLIEASLLREFGDHMNADPAFHAIVDQVVSAMDEEPSLSGTISIALDALLSPGGGG